MRKNLLLKNKKDEESVRKQVDSRMSHFKQLHAGEVERLNQKVDDMNTQLEELQQEVTGAKDIKEKFLSLQAAYEQRGRISNLLGDTEARLLRLGQNNKELLQEVEALLEKNKFLQNKNRELTLSIQEAQAFTLQKDQQYKTKDFNEVEHKQLLHQLTRQLEDRNIQEKALQEKLALAQK